LIERLCALPGIGAWTAHYIAMRALGWPDAFPPNDVAVLKAMKQLFATTTQREADARAQAWQPWRAYAVLRLWNSLEKPSP
jgi:AraC family transcriptional regulator, regulatory protein of adaptative response / DNA-3-methyladenine glycosylase II